MADHDHTPEQGGEGHDVQWLGVFRGTESDPRELGWCSACSREVHEGEGGHSKASPTLRVTGRGDRFVEAGPSKTGGIRVAIDTLVSPHPATHGATITHADALRLATHLHRLAGGAHTVEGVRGEASPEAMQIVRSWEVEQDIGLTDVDAHVLACSIDLAARHGRLAGGSAEGGGGSVPEGGEAIADIVAEASVTDHGDGWFTAVAHVCGDGNGEPVEVRGDSTRYRYAALNALHRKLLSLRDALAGRPGLDTPSQPAREAYHHCATCGGDEMLCRHEGLGVWRCNVCGDVAYLGDDRVAVQAGEREQGPGRDLWERCFTAALQGLVRSGYHDAHMVADKARAYADAAIRAAEDHRTQGGRDDG